MGETLRATLDDLSQLAPDWLVKQISSEWFERYSHRVENYRLPKAESQRTALAEQIGADGMHLLAAVEKPDAPTSLKNEECLQVLRRVWQQYYDLASGKAKWRAGPQAASGEGVIRSPYDTEAESGKKRETVWLGYKVHLTETCASETAQGTEAGTTPQLIVQVHTTVASVQDVETTASIQKDLAQKSLLPDEQIVDTGYIDAGLLVSSQENYGITLVGPVLSDNSWQAKEGKGFDAAHFHLDWQSEQATCPQGQTSHRWGKAGDRIEVVFAREVCADCSVRHHCTKSQTTGRVLHVRPQAAHKALQARRKDEQTQKFRQIYQIRAGIEGTLSQAVRGMGIRRSRYDGLDKTQLQHVLTATAINLVRIDAVLTQTPRGKTRRSSFAKLAFHPDLRHLVAA